MGALVPAWGCAHALQPRAPAALPAVTVVAAPDDAAIDVEVVLRQAGLTFTTIEPDHRWRIVFAGLRVPRIVVHVVRGQSFTVVLGKLFTVPTRVDAGFYRELARRNFELEQMKLSIDADGGVFASFEVPSRILDRRELLENIMGLAAAVDVVTPELQPGDAQEPEESKEPLPQVPVVPGGAGPIIKAERDRLDQRPTRTLLSKKVALALPGTAGLQPARFAEATRHRSSRQGLCPRC